MTNDEQDIIAIKTQIKIFRWVLGGFCTLSMAVVFSLTGWIYTQGSETTSLKRDLKFQEQIIQKHDSTIDLNSKNISGNHREVSNTLIHIKHINKAIQDIKEMLKEFKR